MQPFIINHVKDNRFKNRDTTFSLDMSYKLTRGWFGLKAVQFSEVLRFTHRKYGSRPSRNQ